jgi:hypothetical protein
MLNDFLGAPLRISLRPLRLKAFDRKALKGRKENSRRESASSRASDIISCIIKQTKEE